MLLYVTRRIGFMLVTFWCVVTVTFFLLRLAPGGPFDHERALPPEVEKNLLANYKLDEPLTHQYVRYVGNLLRGDLGPSYKQKDFSVNDLIASGLPVSLKIGGLALLLALTTGVLIGMLAALHRNSVLDHSLSGLVTLGLAFPPIVIAPLMVLLFAVTLRWLPAGGLDSPAHYVLPAVTLAIPYIAAFARLTRGSCIDVLKQPFVTTAMAKGLSTTRVALQHVLPSGCLPVLSYLGPAAATMLAGSMIVEEIFSIPGLGRYFVQGALNRDYTLVLGAVLIYSILILTLNFIVDLLYMKVDPRIKQASQ